MPIILADITTIFQDAFSPLIKVFEAVMVFFHDNLVGGSWGVAIIALTVVVRAALLPLTLKQFHSMSKMQALAPQMSAIKERYKEDKQRQQEETMKLYRENKVNPFGSCLPLLLQFPVFISLFYMLRIDLKTHICGHALTANHIIGNTAVQKTSCGSVLPGSGKFLFINDITTKATGSVLIVLIVLYIGSQLVSSLLMTVTTDKNQRLIAIGIPFVFTFVIIGFPAGLLVYWITSNLWTIVQQFIVKRRVGVPGAPAKDPKAAPPTPTPTATPAVAAATASSRPAGSPPPSARKKKKRSGRRR